MPPHVSVCIFIHVSTYFVRERRERCSGRHRKPQPYMKDEAQPFSVPAVGLGRAIRGDRPDSTLAAHQEKKMALRAPAKERGEASFFIILKFVDSRCVPDLTFLSLPFLFSLHSGVPAFQSEHVLTSSSPI